MKYYGSTSVSDFLGDFVVYRNLEPFDKRLPPYEVFCGEIGLSGSGLPRKTSPAYALAISHLLTLARAIDATGTALERIVYLGDTRMNDGTAFANICEITGWEGMAFIGADRQEPPRVETEQQESATLYLANRWAALGEFEQFCQAHNFLVDGHTAVIVDLDKTAVGARGRNDKVIDQARVAAAHQTVGDILREDFDLSRFEAAYETLNQAEFHPFTADNQDYLVYICLILSSGIYDLKRLVEEVQAGELSGFEQFINLVDAGAAGLPTNLRRIHEEVYGRVREGDPTPFKAFRYNEYQGTVDRMGQMDPDTPVEVLLENEIVVTNEVREVALKWRSQGALLFGLSDKPDEASIPSEELRVQGYQAFHRCESHVIGV